MLLLHQNDLSWSTSTTTHNTRSRYEASVAEMEEKEKRLAETQEMLEKRDEEMEKQLSE